MKQWNQQRWHQVRRWLLRSDWGAATAEFAVVLPALILMIAVLLYTARACVVHMECQEAAANVVRTLIVDPDQSVYAAAGDHVQVSVQFNDDQLEVNTTCKIVRDPMGILPGSVHGHAVGVKQYAYE